ncbi:VanZ family protein [Metaplanococcus flavidus]|uniref:VanZ family protein n=1 Tax=Metaplanococcus flavidus TaxID=569883 RepID=A0ABW3LAY7_9BACL
MLKNRKVAWIIAIGWMAIIFILSHQPGTVSSGLSSGISEMILALVSGALPQIETEIEGFHTLMRKNAHFIAYFILGILLLNALKSNSFPTSRDAIAAFLIAVFYAITDEFHQLFIVGRSGEFRDVMIDSAGAATGIFSYWAIHSLLKKRKNRQGSN